MASYAGDERQDGYGTATAAAAKPRRRRVVNCVVPDEQAAVETFYSTDTKGNDPLRFTTCMSHHIMARIEDDVKRAKMREANPDSAIPSKGYEYDQEASRAVEEYHTTQQLPRSSNVVAATMYSPQNGDFVLPAIAPPSSRSRRNSDSVSQQPSRGNSNATSPSNQARRAAPATSARRPRQQSRSPSRTPQHPAGLRSRSTSKHHPGSNNTSTSVSHSSSPQPRLPAGGRLQPLANDSAQQDGGYRDDGRVVPQGRSRGQATKQLFLEPASFDGDDGAISAEAQRQRRLRLADELARQMDAGAL